MPWPNLSPTEKKLREQLTVLPFKQHIYNDKPYNYFIFFVREEQTTILDKLRYKLEAFLIQIVLNETNFATTCRRKDTELSLSFTGFNYLAEKLGFLSAEQHIQNIPAGQTLLWQQKSIKLAEALSQNLTTSQLPLSHDKKIDSHTIDKLNKSLKIQPPIIKPIPAKHSKFSPNNLSFFNKQQDLNYKLLKSEEMEEILPKSQDKEKEEKINTNQSTPNL